MSYTYQGSEIHIVQPVHSISINKHTVAFADKCGQKLTQFANAMDARQFINWLLAS